MSQTILLLASRTCRLVQGGLLPRVSFLYQARLVPLLFFSEVGRRLSASTGNTREMAHLHSPSLYSVFQCGTHTWVFCRPYSEQTSSHSNMCFSCVFSPLAFYTLVHIIIIWLELRRVSSHTHTHTHHCWCALCRWTSTWLILMTCFHFMLTTVVVRQCAVQTVSRAHILLP